MHYKKYFALCIALLTLCGDACGYLGDDMADTIQLCCNEGAEFAKSHDASECPENLPLSPSVPPAFTSMCTIAKTQCCKEHYQKHDCNTGIDMAASTNSCDLITASSQLCCNECLKGTRAGYAEGPEACVSSSNSIGAEKKRAVDAFVKCCKRAAKNWKGDAASHKSKTLSLATLPSLCEDYAPNELCAHHCIPVPGSYKCECNPGFMLMPDGRNCKEVTRNRCKPHNTCQHKCNDNGLEVKCSCRRGYQLMSDGKSCQDIDECQLDIAVCLPGTECHNLMGSYKCVSSNKLKKKKKGDCPPGFTRNSQNNVCDDINECLLPKPPCPSYMCENTIGAYKCGGLLGDPVTWSTSPRTPVEGSCPPGFIIGLTEECEDFDECAMSEDDCNHLSQFCINTHGSFYCQDKASKHCPPGFKIDPNTNKCKDINECEDDGDICRQDQTCVNQLGQYDCRPKPDYNRRSQSSAECPDGMRKTPGSLYCDDIDECADGTHICDMNQHCLNTNGSYECHCKIGYELDITTGTCADMNECATGQHSCVPEAQRCDNTVGSYLCVRIASCGTGYVLHHSTGECEDIDECALGTHSCGKNYLCYNMVGSFRCVRRRSPTSTTSTTPLPEYEYYYDFEEDNNETFPGNQTQSNPQSSVTTTPTTTLESKPPTTPNIELTTPKATPESIRPEENNVIPLLEDNNVIPLPTTNILPEQEEIVTHVIPTEQPIFKPEPTTTPEPNLPTEPPTELPEVTISESPPIQQPQTSTIEPKIPTLTFEKQPEPPTYLPAEELPKLPEEFPPSNQQPQTSTIEPKLPTLTFEKQPEPPTYLPAEELPKLPEEFPPSNQQPQTSTIEPKIPTLTFEKQPEPPTYLPAEELPKLPEELPTPIQQPQTSTIEPKIPTLTFEKQPEPPTYIPAEELPKLPEEFPMYSSRTDQETTGVKPQEPEPITNESIQPDEKLDTTFTTPTESTIKSSSIPSHSVLVSIVKSTATVPTIKEDIDSENFLPNEIPRNDWTKNDVQPNERPTAVCSFGYKANENGACVDIDECATNRHSCSGLTEICRNTVGGYLCNCAPGFRRDIITNACAFITTSSSTTTTKSTIAPPSAPFSNNKNFWGYPNYRITSRPFRPRNLCDAGFHHNSKTGECEDVNECTNGQANCAAVEICVNTVGGYRCECPPNWILDDIRHRCMPIRKNGQFPPGYSNEPVYPTLPLKNISAGGSTYPEITQVEQQGTVFKCPNGYRLGDDNSCVDVNECLTGEAKCGPQQNCFNLPGGFMCNCPSGHRLIGDHECEDVNECALIGVPICSQNADCLNTVGSFLCKCHKGFRSAPVNDKVCVDVDECVESRSGSLCQHRCNNVWGGYRCSCYRGYKLNTDNSTCSDVDECIEFKSKIPCVGRCLNEPGSYRCACPSGYRLSGDQRSCIDIDECETGEAPCAKGGATSTMSDVCVNTRGGYRCHRIVCPQGYQLENKHRCNKVEKICLPGDYFCTHQPTTISYNFITFVSNLYIPDSKLNLFTMRGPQWQFAKLRFGLRLIDVNAPPSVKRKADISDFLLSKNNSEGLMSLVQPLEGPQSIELEMSMELYTREQFGGTVIAKLFIYVSEYEF